MDNGGRGSQALTVQYMTVSGHNTTQQPSSSMLKHPGPPDASMCVSDDRPRKKLSFREPEVVTSTRNSAHHPQSVLHLPNTPATLPLHSVLHHPSQEHPGQHHSQHHGGNSLPRPHSVAGIVGLSGFSALGGVPGLSNMTSFVMSQGVTSSGSSVLGVTSMVGNPGLLPHPGVLPRPPTTILTPPTSPTHANSHSHLPSPNKSQQSPSASSQTPTSLARVAQSISKPQASQPHVHSSAKMSSSHQPTSPSVKSANPLIAAFSPKSPVRELMSHHHGRAASLQPSTTKSLPPSGNKNTGTSKSPKPASRNSSLKKQRSSPVQQAVTFLTEHGIVNGRSRGLANTTTTTSSTTGANSLEDINLESQAMRVVRTVGQAFEVCHKISVKDTPQQDSGEDEASEQGSDASTEKLKKDLLDTESTQEDLVTLTPSDSVNEDAAEHLLARPNKLEPLAPPAGTDIFLKGAGETYTSPLSEPLPSGDTLPMAGTPLSVHHELQLLREQLEQQQQQTQAAVSQVHLLRDQLAAETAARLEAQARTHQLLVHNKELLEHIQALVLQVRELELKMAGSGGNVMPTLQLLPSPPDMKAQLTVPAAAAGHGHTSRLAAALDLGGTASLLPASLLLHSPDSPPTPSPSLAHHHFLFPSQSSPSPSNHQDSPSCSGAVQHCGSSPQCSEGKAQAQAQAQAVCVGPLIHPLPLWGAAAEGNRAKEVTLDVPQQEQQANNTKISQQQQQQQGVNRNRPPPRTAHHPHHHLQHLHTEEQSSTPSLGSESDLKSSGESVTQAVAQLYALEPQCLPKLPEDAVTLGPYAPTPLGAQRSLNGPITRTASERVSRQETLAQLQRMAWARHTTK